MPKMTVANLTIDSELGRRALVEYAARHAETLTYYDFAGAGPGGGTAHNGITLASFGRVTFFDSRLSARNAAALMHAGQVVDWDLLPMEARLADADPELRDGLYDAAESFYRQFLEVDARMHAAEVSKLLHLNRPHLFPVLDSPIRVLYGDRAAAAWARTDRREKPRSGRSYWPVIREDIVAAAPEIASWRAHLSSSGDELVAAMASLSDVRLWDIATRSLAVSAT